jgi:hypothetical protein
VELKDQQVKIEVLLGAICFYLQFKGSYVECYKGLFLLSLSLQNAANEYPAIYQESFDDYITSTKTDYNLIAALLAYYLYSYTHPTSAVLGQPVYIF